MVARGHGSRVHNLKWLFEVDTETSPANSVGEFLRSQFWDQSGDKYGCYSTFTYRDGVEALPLEVDGEGTDWEIKWQCARWNGVECRWYWDGDGVLQFIFPDGSVLENSDCKKDYTWEWTA